MMRLFFWLLLLILGGCGYAPVTLGPGIEVSTLFVEPFSNRTSEPFLDSIFSSSLIERFGRDHRLTLMKQRKEAEAVLTGTISSYSRSAVAYDRLDNITEYRSQMTVTASLRRVADDKVLWNDTVSWTEESLNPVVGSSADRLTEQQDEETTAIRKIAERLAEQVYYRMQDNF